jgi:hypothetical protein
MGGFKKPLQPAKIFANDGLNNEASAKCQHKQQFGLDVPI